VAGLLLGGAAFPAILTALLLRAMLFQFGDLTVLGVNTVDYGDRGNCHGFLPGFFRKR
jgi:cobalt/nickel transport system permease protein